MRGEHLPSVFILDPDRGSSPHARGTPSANPNAPIFNGIIPACAGEHVAVLGVEGESRGSSPHARGTHVGSRNKGSSDGIIPACAGNTRSSRQWP